MSTMNDKTISPTAARLAARVTPGLLRSLEARKETIIAASGNLFQRQAVRLIWPLAMRQAPAAVEAGVDAVLDQFGGMTLADVAGLLVAHQKSKGHMPSPGWLAAANAPRLTSGGGSGATFSMPPPAMPPS